jgi:diguanylate cyclase (GGDEF)-like protein
MKTFAVVLPSATLDLTNPGSARDTSHTSVYRKLEEVMRENAELKRTLTKLQAFREMAYRDQLTDLGNRRYFEERLNQELSRARRDPSRRFSVMVIDLNNMKVINDTHGHATGDRALKWVGGFLKSVLRTHDVPCRLGGDEFAVLLPDTGSNECIALIARLRTELLKANEKRDIPIGLSFGTATFLEDGANARNLLLCADTAMYRDKRRQKELE